jgi:hypothetical protein
VGESKFCKSINYHCPPCINPNCPWNLNQLISNTGSSCRANKISRQEVS